VYRYGRPQRNNFVLFHLLASLLDAVFHDRDLSVMVSLHKRTCICIYCCIEPFLLLSFPLGSIFAFSNHPGWRLVRITAAVFMILAFPPHPASPAGSFGVFGAVYYIVETE
jgi:hypothetical protein